MGKCVVTGAGDFFGLKTEIVPGDLLIAADVGYDRLMKNGIRPDMVIGDFDSREDGKAPEHEAVVTLPRVKDVTDMDAACEEGFRRGYREFHLFGGTGGRLGHTIANIQLMKKLSERGAIAFLYGDGSISTVIRNDRIEFSRGYEGMISVFSLSDHSRGVSIQGLKYELRDAILDNSFPLGVSNEFKGMDSRIEVRDGSLLIIWQGNDTGKVQSGKLQI